ncbi:hypothetical protein KUW09_24875 [Mameliella alba]|nr:hypothetical protein [Antarctobacter heliothermus]MBY6147303.1 hypothetical protein [Mameliella alba]
MRFAFAPVFAVMPVFAWADADSVLKQNCMALIAFQTAPATFHSEASISFEAFLIGSQIGRTADVMAAFTEVCTTSPDWSIIGAMRKAVATLD